jgi:aspartate/methionine/tyrosine aminotransferase
MVDTDIEATSTSVLLRRHAELEALHGDGDSGRFLSGWQCETPWSGELRKEILEVRRNLSDEKYQHLDDDSFVSDGVVEFHSAADRTIPSAVFCGEGSSSLIFTTCAWLKEKNIDEVFYVPPLYFTMHFSLKLLGIRARAVSGRHAFEERFSMNLPSKSTVLLLSDPIWYAGLPIATEIIGRIARWQRETQSFIFVDGSFQYMRWDGTSFESTAEFEPDRTIRIICPTKSLALHGYRFAYALLPRAERSTFSRIYNGVYGSSSAENIAFARVAATALGPKKIRASLLELSQRRYKALRSSGKIFANWEARCGYFVFERILVRLPKGMALMDGSFFEQKRYRDHRRINLLSPSIGLLG